MRHSIGVIAGSFDPITNGHKWLIEQALSVVDFLWIVVGNNPTKKYLFTEKERVGMVDKVAQTIDDSYGRYDVTTLDNQMLIAFAAAEEAKWLIRGIRNPQDFEYEHTMQLVNKRIRPNIETMFFVPPRELTEVSSSTVKSMVGYDGWKEIVSQYVDPHVVDLLDQKVIKK